MNSTRATLLPPHSVPGVEFMARRVREKGALTAGGHPRGAREVLVTSPSC